MRRTYDLSKATPLKLLFNSLDEPGVGRIQGKEVIPTTKSILTELNIPTSLKEDLLKAQKKIYAINNNQKEILKEMREYQIEDILFLATRKSAGCFNEQRTGKTPTSLKAFKLKGLTKILIICPSSAVIQWKDEYERWYESPCVAVTGTTKHRNKLIAEWTHGLILGYDCLKIKDYKDPVTKEYSHSIGDVAEILKHKNIDGVIADEIHRIRNYKTKTAEAMFKLSKIENKLALSGTPTTGKQEEIYSTLHFLYPHIFTGYWRFIDYYFTKNMLKFWDGRRLKERVDSVTLKKDTELQEFLNVISTSRKRKDVMPWLPDKEQILLRFDCDEKQAKYLSELHEYFETEGIITQGILDRLMRERQICLSPALLGLSGASPKLEWIKQYIEDYPEKSILIFSKFTKWLELLAKELKQPYLITGPISKEERDKNKKLFQAGKIKVLLINIDAGKEALTLDTAETAIFTDKFSPVGDIEQAEDRFVATTEDKASKAHTIYTLVMRDTYEENIIQSLTEKKGEIDLINDYKKYLKEGKSK